MRENSLALERAGGRLIPTQFSSLWLQRLILSSPYELEVGRIKRAIKFSRLSGCVGAFRDDENDFSRRTNEARVS
jgi:hypothetical protein